MPSKIRIGILETGPAPDALARHGRSADWFIRILSETPYDFTFTVYQAFAGDMPKTLDACDAYLVTGSPNSATAPDAWIAELSTFLIDVAEHRPVVGVCFGHQLLHNAFGGKVEKSTQGWGIGVHEYTTALAPDWMVPYADNIRLLVSHQDQVAQLAPNAVSIAGSDFCPNAITTIGPNILTIQGHPDYTDDFARDLYHSRRGRIGDAQVETALQSLEVACDSKVVTEWMARFISDRC